MIKVTARRKRARAISSFTHFAFSIVQNDGYGSSLLSHKEREVGTITQTPTGVSLLDDKTRSTHDASCRSPMCVKK